MNDVEVLQQALALRRQGVAFCLATVVEVRGSTPRGPGAKMILAVDGTSWGSIGGGCGEGRVRSVALRCLLDTGEPARVEVLLTDDVGLRGGDVCGGTMLVLVEPFLPAGGARPVGVAPGHAG